MSAWTAARDAVLALALAPLAYYLIALLAAARFFRGNTSTATQPPLPKPVSFTPSISILKPIRGLDRETYDNYASFCRQDYPEFELMFCVSDEEEPALPVIRKLLSDFPERRIRLLVGAEPVGASDKVNKLCRMAREARHEVLLVSDSDVRVEPDFLRAVVAPFEDSKVGGVTCLYRGRTDGSLAADLEALGNSTDFAPSVIVARLLGELNFMLGAVMATTKKRVEELGGFEALADYFCDDYELGNRIAGRGYRLELSHFPVEIVYPHETLADAFRHQLRWNLSIRFSRPAGHLGLILTQGLPWALLAALVAPSAGVAVGYLAGYVLLRGAMASVVGAKGMRDALAQRRMWMVPLRDAFAFVVWMASFFPRRIQWRDREFRVREKRLVPVASRQA